MSRLPLEDRNVWGVRGPDYEPGLVCAHPFCDAHPEQGYPPLERHHLWPRSFLRHQPTEWVKLPDGKIVQNCVYLCREHHQQITENKARIEWVSGRDVFLWWSGDKEAIFERLARLNDGEPADPDWRAGPLAPQPRFQDSLSEGGSSELRAGDSVPVADSGESVPLTESESHVHEGQECPTCHRRVPRKRKPTTPTSAVTSFRYPLDEKEQLEEIWEAVAKHLGVYEQGFWKHAAVIHAFAIALQGPGVDE